MLKSRALPTGTVLTGADDIDAHRLCGFLMYNYRTRLSIVLHKWNDRILRVRSIDAKRQALYGDALEPPPADGHPTPAAARALAEATGGGLPPTSCDGRSRSLLSGGSSGS